MPEWQAGQTVCLSSNRGRNLSTVRIARVTPSGLVVLTSGDRYKANGQKCGGGDYQADFIQEMNPTLAREVARKRLYHQVNGLLRGLTDRCFVLDGETLHDLLKMLERAKMALEVDQS